MSLRSAYSTIFQPVLQDGSPFQGQINAAIPGNVAIGDSTTAYTLSINSQTITSASGNLNISGNISATGSLTVSAATVSNALNVSGITTVSALSVQNYLNVSGLSSLSNVNICGGVNITGNTFLNSNLEVKRSLSAESVYSTTLSGVVNINGAPYVSGGNPFNWSTKPAISDVNIAGYSISGVSNLTVSNNVSISGSTTINSGLSAESVYATTLSGITLINGAPYVPGVNPANWSTYPAVTNLSMGGFNIGNINAVSISGRLVVDGSATFNGVTRLSNADVSGLLSVSGGNVQNKWNVSGQLNAENASIVANLGVSGDAILSNAYVTALYGGATTLSSLSVQSNVSVSGETLLVGKVTISDVLNVSGLTTISGLTVQNDLSVGGIVYATNLSAVSFINGISFNAAGIPSNWASYGAVVDVNLSGNDIYNVDNLNVSGLSTFAGGLTVPALATISHANVIGTVSSSIVFISNALNVSGLTTLSGMVVQNLLSGNNISITNDLSAQDAYISNVLNVSGLASLSGLFVPNVATISDLFTTSSRIHIGQSAGFSGQSSLEPIAIGYQAGETDQGQSSIAIGRRAGNSNQTGGIAIGQNAGLSGQGNCIAIGQNAGLINQQWSQAIAIGNNTARYNQSNNAIAIGANAGESNQFADTIAIGRAAGNLSQATQAIAIGRQAGLSGQGSNSIAIGFNAGQVNQISNSIILNANGGTVLDAQTQSGFYVAPVSQSSNLSGLQMMTYNPTTFQIQQNSNFTISGGLLGIAVTNPSTALDISGQLRIADFNNGGIIHIGRNGASTFGRRAYIYHDGTNMEINNQQSNGALSFWSSNTQRMTILSNGNVGIALTNPSYALDVTGVIRTSQGGVNGGLLEFGQGGISTNGRRAYIYHDGTNMSILNQQAGYLGFGTSNSERMTILSNGNVGINCNAPGYTLDVNGTINCTTLRTANPPSSPAFTNIAASGYTTDAIGTKGGGYNFSSVTSNSLGNYTINFTTDIGTTNYIGLFTSITNRSYCVVTTRTSSNVTINTYDGAGQFSILFNFVIYK